MATRKYKRITYKDRQNLEKLFKTGITKKDIYEQLGISRETLRKELERGTNPITGEYEALLAQKNYCSAPK